MVRSCGFKAAENFEKTHSKTRPVQYKCQFDTVILALYVRAMRARKPKNLVTSAVLTYNIFTLTTSIVPELHMVRRKALRSLDIYLMAVTASEAQNRRS